MPRSSFRFHYLLSAVLLLTFSCTYDFSNVPEGAQITCRSNADCPASMVCNTGTGFCVKEIDPNPPKFTDTPVLTPLFVKKDAVVTLSFEADKDLLRVPDVRVKISGEARPFTLDEARSAEKNYVFNYTATGDEPEQDEFSVVVTMIDKSGNRAEDVRVGALRFDFHPPACAEGSTAVRLASDYPANPLLNAQSVTNGTKVTVSFNLTEDLYMNPADRTKDSPSPKVVFCKFPDCNPVNPGEVTVLDLNSAASTGRSYAFTGKADGVPAGVDFQSKVYIVPSDKGGIFDYAGNVLDQPLEVTQLSIKTTTPEAPTIANVFYRRIPWGMKDISSGKFVDKKFSVVCNACMFSSDIEMVLVYDSSTATTGGLIGFAQSPRTGNAWNFTEIVLNGSDRAHVYMATADSAGNLSPVTEIKDAEWVATMGYKVPGSEIENPHVFKSTGIFQKKLEQDLFDFEPEVFSTDGLLSVAQTGRQNWSQIRSLTVNDLPSARSGHAMAYESARGKLVLFGGYDGSKLLNDTWEWDGTNWMQKYPVSSPPARSGHSLAYDSSQGKVVLFGGGNNDTWEWDGENWEQKAPLNNPSVRSGHALAYDSVRGRVVLFGGAAESSTEFLDDTWEWDGSNWTQKPLGSSPSGRYAHAMAFDSARGRVVLFGGCDSFDSYSGECDGYKDDTWEWDGRSWAQNSPALSPSGRGGHALAHDLIRGKTVLHGGYDGSNWLNDTWEWDGSNWVSKNIVSKPPILSGHAMAFDSMQGKVVLFGGYNSFDRNNDFWEWNGQKWSQKVTIAGNNLVQRSAHILVYDSARKKIVMFGGRSANDNLDDIWEWDGETWLQKFPGFGPEKRSGHAAAFDSARNKTVLFGGVGDYFDHTAWEWDGTFWSWEVSFNEPSGRSGHAMAYDSARMKVVLFGGYGSDPFEGYGSFNDTWEWDGSEWIQKTPATMPSLRSGHSMAFDSGRGKVVLFGGYEGSNRFDDTWEWDGSNWSMKISATTPTARSGHAMAYDSARGKVVLFGGYEGSSRLNDTWEWDGTNWTQKIPATIPPIRSGHAMAYDSGRGKVVLFGGYGDSNKLNDTWEWDGTTWVLKTAILSPPGRYGHAMAYNGSRNETISFGGYSNNVWFNDTWGWKGSFWTKKAAAAIPPVRVRPVMAYDDNRGEITLFGGYHGSEEMNDTWEWDGTNWTQKFPPTSPPGRNAHAMAYDGKRKKVVLFGGYGGSGSLNDTWEWDGTNWTQRSPVTSPSASMGHAMAFDGRREKTVLFIGGDNGTWEWDGSNWAQIKTVSSPGISVPAMVYDGDRGRIVLYNGSNYNATWEWDGANWRPKSPATTPSTRAEHSMAYDIGRGKVVLFGGHSGSSGLSDTWEWDGQGRGFPGQQVQIAALATGIIQDVSKADIQQISTRFVSGGTGYPSGVEHKGVSLMAWYDNEWHTMASNSDGPKTPGLVEWTTTDAGMIQKLVNSYRTTFNFAVVPQAPNGFGHPDCPLEWTADECDMGMVSTEYVEVTLKYTLP